MPYCARRAILPKASNPVLASIAIAARRSQTVLANILLTDPPKEAYFTD
jgi:hypothetical protein